MELRPIGQFLLSTLSAKSLTSLHATEYLTDVADAQFARDLKARIQWLNDSCSSLKHDPKGPQVLIDVMQGALAEQKLGGPRDKIKAALTLFKNQQPLMKYAEHLEQFLPLGSGVTEAACKTIVFCSVCVVLE